MAASGMRMVNGVVVHPEHDEYAQRAYNCGQPFMDSVVAALLERGACTPAMRAEYLRMGLLDETKRNVFLTLEERERIWDNYGVRGPRRWFYQFRAWLTRQRVMRTA